MKERGSEKNEETKAETRPSNARVAYQAARIYTQRAPLSLSLTHYDAYYFFFSPLSAIEEKCARKKHVRMYTHIRICLYIRTRVFAPGGARASSFLLRYIFLSFPALCALHTPALFSFFSRPCAHRRGLVRPRENVGTEIERILPEERGLSSKNESERRGFKNNV